MKLLKKSLVLAALGVAAVLPSILAHAEDSVAQRAIAALSRAIATGNYQGEGCSLIVDYGSDHSFANFVVRTASWPNGGKAVQCQFGDGGDDTVKSALSNGLLRVRATFSEYDPEMGRNQSGDCEIAVRGNAVVVRDGDQQLDCQIAEGRAQ